ncbi:thiamine-phosphate kinase [Porphyrobacter algicida]|uniref:Thiamine-monophosphate kinase n=1 Tax=Qipengyuania algicida TaxID=1836209 RepID=A0A845ADE8_9SPHN|nr:thiamine-phosphate kinase [Qipengyuania algicida]MXP27263.1 thiamine-phosphate kinase [Qipengyuania algicida]
MRALATNPAARGLSDDAAVLQFGGEALVLTHDVLAEGVHVLPEQDPADIAWKLVAVNLSDLAAKGAEPLGVLLGHTLGAGDERFLAGLGEVLAEYGVPLLGGDTIAAQGPRSWGCTAIGRATHRPVPSRSGARVGDHIFVTGTLGKALLGFEALRDRNGADHTAYSRPRPRLAEGQALAVEATAMMDISDGLLLDGWRMGEASGVTLALDAQAIPVAEPNRRRECLSWGDDYELLFTFPPDRQPPVPAHRIGAVVAKGGSAISLDGEFLTSKHSLGYVHG